MRVVTTCHKAGFEQYGHRLLETIKNWPGAELWWYTEGFTLPETVKAKDCDSLERLQAFKRQYVKFTPPNYLWDVVRFANKVFAAYDALRDHDGLGAWIDADCVIYNKIPEGYLETQLGDAYMALFKRKGLYTETGFWLVNCAHDAHKAFMDTWLQWYETASFKGLANWTDCETLDATVRKFEKAGLIKTASLSGGFESDMHPMAKADLGRFIDHCKGNRKEAGFSAENRHRLTDEPYQLNDCK